MKVLLIVVFCAASTCRAQSGARMTRIEAEYYVEAYAKHYQVPLALVRAIVDRESNWQLCTVSPKGALGLMQLMPMTAKTLGVTDRCSLNQNVSGGVCYLAWLMQRFHNDLRLVAAAYYVGEGRIGSRALLTKILMSLHMCQELEQLIFAKQELNNKGKNITEKRDVR